MFNVLYNLQLYIYIYTGNPRLAQFRLALTLVSTVELFVTMARLARGQT